MATCTRPPCASLSNDNLNIVPNPDISGIGVLISFLATAYMTLILVLIHYLLDCGPEPAVNPIDRGIIDFVWRKMGRRPRKELGVALRRGVLMFSDQQVVTGIAILSAGYSQLHCGLSSYHWGIVVRLAWFSSVTHLTTLTVLCQYFRDNPLIRNWRVAFMFATVALLTSSLLPTGHSAWGSYPRVPAQCFFDALAVGFGTERYSAIDRSTTSMFISLVVLVVSFVTRTIKLSKRCSVLTRRWMRSKPGGLIKRWLGQLNRRATVSGACFLWKLVHQVLLGAYVMLKAICDINESMLWEINWLIYALAWGSALLYTARHYVHGNDNDPRSEEDSWGFGQLIPLLLLMLPLLAMGETSYELLRDSASKDDQRNNIHSPAHGAGSLITHSSRADPLQGTDHHATLIAGPINGATSIAITSVSRAGSALGSGAENVAPDNHGRIGSMISQSEHTIGTAGAAHLASEPSTNQTDNTSYDRDFYQYVWFRLLILLILLIICFLAISMIAFFQDSVLMLLEVLRGLQDIIMPVAIYSFLFVCLDGYRGAISNFLQRLRIRREVQHKLLAYLPYLVLIGLLPFPAFRCFLGESVFTLLFVRD